MLDVGRKILLKFWWKWFSSGILYSAKIQNKCESSKDIFRHERCRSLFLTMIHSFYFFQLSNRKHFLFRHIPATLKNISFFCLPCSYGWLYDQVLANVVGGLHGDIVKREGLFLLPICRHDHWSSNIHFDLVGFLENESHSWRIMEKKDGKLCPWWQYEPTIPVLYCLPPNFCL